MNKLGFHVNWVKSEVLSATEKVKPLVIKTLHHDVDFWKQVREVHPAAFIVGRLYEPHQEFESDPERSGRDFADRVLAEQVNDLGLYNAWESFNERIISSHPKELYEKYDRFQVAFAQRLRERYPELEAVAMNFATGNLADRDFVEYFPRTLETHKYLGFHEYDWPTMWRLHEQGLKDGNEGMWLCLKYRRFMREVRKEYGDQHVAIITECGMTQAVHPGLGDVGWRTELTEEQYWQSLKWYNDRLCEDDYVMGCCIFVVGGTGDWATFETLGPTIDRIAALPKTTPTEETTTVKPETVVTTTETPADLTALAQEVRALGEQVGKLEVLWDTVIRKLVEEETTPVEPETTVPTTETPADLTALAQEVRALDEQVGKLEVLWDAAIRKLAE
jgi:hypothetical protein